MEIEETAIKPAEPVKEAQLTTGARLYLWSSLASIWATFGLPIALGLGLIVCLAGLLQMALTLHDASVLDHDFAPAFRRGTLYPLVVIGLAWLVNVGRRALNVAKERGHVPTPWYRNPVYLAAGVYVALWLLIRLPLDLKGIWDADDQKLGGMMIAAVVWLSLSIGLFILDQSFRLLRLLWAHSQTRPFFAGVIGTLAFASSINALVATVATGSAVFAFAVGFVVGELNEESRRTNVPLEILAARFDAEAEANAVPFVESLRLGLVETAELQLSASVARRGRGKGAPAKPVLASGGGNGSESGSGGWGNCSLRFLSPTGDCYPAYQRAAKRVDDILKHADDGEYIVTGAVYDVCEKRPSVGCGYVYKTAVHRALDRAGKPAYASRADLNENGPFPYRRTAYEKMLADTCLRMVSAKMGSLVSEEDQAIIDMRLDGSTYNEIAKVLGMRADAVRKRHGRALQKLRENVSRDCWDVL